MRSLFLSVCVAFGVNATAQVEFDRETETTESINFYGDGVYFNHYITQTESYVSSVTYASFEVTSAILMFNEKEDVKIVFSNGHILSFDDCSITMMSIDSDRYVYSVTISDLSVSNLTIMSNYEMLKVKIGEIETESPKKCKKTLVKVCKSFLDTF